MKLSDVLQEEKVYKLAVVDDEADAIFSAAVDQATEDMNFISRPIARTMVKRHAKVVYALCRVQLDAGKFRFLYEDEPAIEVAEGEEQLWANSRGEEYRATVELEGSTVTQSLVGKHGSKIFQMQFEEGGNMNATVVLKSARMDHDVVYQLPYELAVDRV